jgi:thiol-disulfide isomerase/thioredoxin
MKKKIAIIFLGLGIVGMNNIYAQKSNTKTKEEAKTYQSVAIGTDIPLERVAMEDVISGTSINLKELMGKSGILIMFSCNTCPYVIKAERRTKEILSIAEENGYGVAIINSNEAQRNDVDSREAMKIYGVKHGYPNYFLDENSAYANKLRANRTPEVFLYNKEGKLVYKGAMDDNPAEPENVEVIYLAEAMRNAIAGLPINPTQTKSIGCTIKRVK